MRTGTTLVFLVWTGCGNTETASPDDDARHLGAPVDAAAKAETPSPPVVHGPPAKSPPSSAPPGRDPGAFVSCARDADCGWNHECIPTLCVQAGLGPVACDESAPPPGTCSCIEGACTLRPDHPPAPTGPCEVRGCMVDRAGGRCVADTGGVREELRTTPPVSIGPSCDCERPAEGCTFTWFDPVPCSSDRECWIDPSPRRHPVARPKALRKRDFVPCADGEVAPKCGPAGVCIVGPAYSC